MLHAFPELIKKDLLNRAAQLSVAQLCDGMKELNIPNYGCICAEINAINPAMKMVGTAATVETENGDNFPIHIATYAIPCDGYVMVIDGKSYPHKSYIGDLIMGAAQAAGYAGIVIDGYSRDRQGTIELEFPVYSRGLHPAGPIKNNPGEINTTIQCGGVTVNPGDLVVGDYDGVCVVPKERIEEVLLKAEAKKDYEDKRESAIAIYKAAKLKSEPLPELAPDWVLKLL